MNNFFLEQTTEPDQELGHWLKLFGPINFGVVRLDAEWIDPPLAPTAPFESRYRAPRTVGKLIALITFTQEYDRILFQTALPKDDETVRLLESDERPISCLSPNYEATRVLDNWKLSLPSYSQDLLVASWLATVVSNQAVENIQAEDL